MPVIKEHGHVGRKTGERAQQFDSLLEPNPYFTISAAPPLRLEGISG